MTYPCAGTSVLLVLTLVLLVPAPGASAHDESQHAGKAVHGAVTAVSGDHLTVTTDDGSLAVTLTEGTAVEQGGTRVDRSAIQPKGHVSMSGARLPGGEMVAKEVRIEAPEGSDAQVPKSHDH